MIPLSSSDPPNLHAELGLDDSARRLLWPGTIDELRRRGFEPQGQIAQGATSVVISCKERSTGRTLVVKVCYDPTNSVALELFQRERQILASDHGLGDLLPHYYGGVDQSGPQSPGGEPCQPFLLLESIPGRRICDYIAESRDFPLIHKVQLCAALARAVQRMHDANLVHGDISSNNVLVCKGDRIRLIDVGQGGRLAHGYRSVHSVSGQAGTGGFSPANLLAREVRPSQSTDLRQCAAVVFHALTGQLAGSQPEQKGVRRQIAILKEHELPHPLIQILIRGLRDRNPRLAEEDSDPRLYASAGALADDLDRWSTSQQAPRRTPSYRTGLGISLLVLAGLLGIVRWLWPLDRQPDSGRQVATLLSRCEALPNREHPAIATLLRQESSLSQQQRNLSTMGDRDGALRMSQERVRTLEQALAIGSDLAWMAPLREGLTVVLTQSPWIETAPTIASAVAALREHSDQLRRQLERGETQDAAVEIIAFHRRLAEATRHNADARPVVDQRRTLETMLSRLPPRLAESAERQAFQERRGVAEQAWTAGDWGVARQLFGQLLQDLDQWVECELTAEEKPVVREASVALTQQLQHDLVQSQEQNRELEARVLHLNRQIQELTATGLEKQRELEQRLTSAEAARTQMEGTEKSQRQELTRLQADLKSTQENLQSQEQRLELANRSLAEWKRHAAESDRLLQQLSDKLSSEAAAGRASKGQPPAAMQAGTVAGERLVLPWGPGALAFRWCPPGQFRMGSPATEPGRESNEDPVDVTLTSGFWMLETEVTQALWVAVMGKERQSNWEEQHGLGDNYPAYRIPWDEVQQFCVRLTASLREQGKLPRGWRLELPTEAQWEYACRAGGTGRFCFGDDERDLQRFAWYVDNAEGTNHPVATREPNRWGLHDLHGSVWEWTQSHYDKPLAGGIDPRGGAGGASRVRRGGSWIASSASCRSATRNGFTPRWSDYLGFRPCLVAAPEVTAPVSTTSASTTPAPAPPASPPPAATEPAALPPHATTPTSPPPGATPPAPPLPESTVPDSATADSTRPPPVPLPTDSTAPDSIPPEASTPDPIAPASPTAAATAPAAPRPAASPRAPIPQGPLPPGQIPPAPTFPVASTDPRQPPLQTTNTFLQVPRIQATGGASSSSNAPHGLPGPAQRPTPAIATGKQARVSLREHRSGPDSATEGPFNNFYVACVGLALFFIVLGQIREPRIVADGSGIKRVDVWGRKVRLLMWKDVRCWRVESYEAHDEEAVVWKSRLVVELLNAPPLMIAESWFPSVVKELRSALPDFHTPYAELVATRDRPSERSAAFDQVFDRDPAGASGETKPPRRSEGIPDQTRVELKWD